MSTKYIPPKSQYDISVDRIKGVLRTTLASYNGDDLEGLVNELFEKLKTVVVLPKKPDKGVGPGAQRPRVL